MLQSLPYEERDNLPIPPLSSRTHSIVLSSWSLVTRSLCTYIRSVRRAFRAAGPGSNLRGIDPDTTAPWENERRDSPATDDCALQVEERAAFLTERAVPVRPLQLLPLPAEPALPGEALLELRVWYAAPRLCLPDPPPPREVREWFVFPAVTRPLMLSPTSSRIKLRSAASVSVRPSPAVTYGVLDIVGAAASELIVSTEAFPQWGATAGATAPAIWARLWMLEVVPEVGGVITFCQEAATSLSARSTFWFARYRSNIGTPGGSAWAEPGRRLHELLIARVNPPTTLDKTLHG